MFYSTNGATNATVEEIGSILIRAGAVQGRASGPGKCKCATVNKRWIRIDEELMVRECVRLKGPAADTCSIRHGKDLGLELSRRLLEALLSDKVISLIILRSAFRPAAG